VLELAARQNGVVSLAQMISIGFSGSAVWKAVQAGRLHRIHHGVYAVGRPELALRGRFMAAVLACGEGAVLSHGAAAALHGIRKWHGGRIDVSVPRESPISRPGIRTHRHPGLRPADVTVVDGIPVTSVSRTLLGLATFQREPQIERVCNQAATMRCLDMREMSDLLKRSRGRRGVRRLRNVLARGDLGENVPASGLEVRYRHLCAEAGLPKPEINRFLLLGDEYHKVDFLWRRQRVVIETDGSRYHSTGWQLARDAHRDELLTEHGYLHGRVREDEIEQAPNRAVARARDLLVQATRTTERRT
jgi:very-short-patch-repair endonuclease